MEQAPFSLIGEKGRIPGRCSFMRAYSKNVPCLCKLCSLEGASSVLIQVIVSKRLFPFPPCVILPLEAERIGGV